MDQLPERLHLTFAKTKTICVGRYLIDVPETAQVVYGPSRIPFDTERYEGRANDLQKLVAERLIEVQDEKDYAFGALRKNDSMVGKVLQGAMPGQKLVFGVSKTTGTFYNLESWIPVGDDVFIQATEASASRERYEEDIGRLNSIAKLLRARRNADVPDEPGVCIDGAILLDPPQSGVEAVALGVRLMDFPDVHFSVSMTKKSILVDSDRLERRLAKGEENARSFGAGEWYSRIKLLRRGARDIAGWKGEEVLVHKPAQKVEGESHEFVFISQGEPNDPYRPSINIQLDTGVENDRTGARPPSITDPEAVALWDKLISTIRVRPTRTAAVDERKGRLKE